MNEKYIAGFVNAKLGYLVTETERGTDPNKAVINLIQLLQSVTEYKVTSLEELSSIMDIEAKKALTK